MFIINAPIIFRAVWAMVNPLLEERTRRKIIIVGYDYMPLLKQVRFCVGGGTGGGVRVRACM